VAAGVAEGSGLASMFGVGVSVGGATGAAVLHATSSAAISIDTIMERGFMCCSSGNDGSNLNLKASRSIPKLSLLYLTTVYRGLQMKTCRAAATLFSCMFSPGAERVGPVYVQTTLNLAMPTRLFGLVTTSLTVEAPAEPMW
jgi:hypothetical protein